MIAKRNRQFGFIARISRVVFILVWITLLFMIASNIQAGWLYVVISFFLLFTFVSVAYPMTMLRRLTVRLTMPEFTERGAATGATLTVLNNGKRARYMVRARIAGPDFTLEPEGALFVRIAPGAEESMPVRVICTRRGRRGPGAFSMTCGAPAGIFTAQRRVSCDSETIVYPSAKKIQGGEPLREPGLHDPGPIQRMVAAQDPYHYTLREYVPGDSLRSIHWKLTARLAEPIVRVQERKITGRAVVRVDNDRNSYGPCCEDEFESALEDALASARYLLIDHGYTVTIEGTVSPGITIHTEAAWETALRWFAMINLESPLEDIAANTANSGADVNLTFGSKNGA